MNKKPNSTDGPRTELPLWADRYARNRVQPVIVMIIFVAVYSGLLSFGVASLIALSTHGGHSVLIILAVIYNLAIIGSMIWLSVTGRRNRIFQSIELRLTSQEGNAVPAGQTPSKQSTLPRYLTMLICFSIPSLILGGIYVAIHVVINVFKVPGVFLQPAMAVVIVPLYIWQIARTDNPKWLGLICPALYSIHAVLILAGVRLSVFTASQLAGSGHLYVTAQQLLEVYLPFSVYQLLYIFAKHLYSRYALLKLQVAALSPLDETGEPDGEDVGNAGA